MGRVSNFFKTKKVVKIIGIVIIIIVLILAIWLWSIFGASFKVVGILGKINGTSYSLGKSKSSAAYNGRCKVNVYPSENLYVPDLVQDQTNKQAVFLYVGSATSNKKGAVSITVESMAEVSDSIVSSFNTITSTKEPTISREYNTLNYFVYNGRNYFYNLNPYGIMFTTPINNNYLYWVMIQDYSNLTKEDIESILYFEVV